MAYDVFNFLAGNLVFKDGRFEYRKEKGYGNLGIYIVIFRVLNNDKKEIIYKAKFYHYVFIMPLLQYFIYKRKLIKQGNMLEAEVVSPWTTELGTYETIVDSELINLYMPISLVGQDKIYSLENPEFRKDFIKITKDKEWWTHNPTCFYNDLTYGLNMDIMIDLFVLAYEKNALDYMRTLWSSEDFLISNGGWVHDNNISQKINTNMLNNRVFVVRNVDFFIEKIRAKIKNKGYTLSGPPKPLRHLHSRLDNYLSYIDLDFRLALYYHLQLHLTSCNNSLLQQQLSKLTYEEDFTIKIDEFNARYW